MRRTVQYRKSYITVAVILIIIISFGLAIHLNAAGELMKWRKLDAMDTNFTIVNNKAGDDDLLIELDVEDAGTYDLYYYLEDGRQTYIQFVQSYNDVTVEYHIRESDGAGGFTDITQDQVDLSYLEMNYDLTVPDWEFDGNKLVGASGGLEYSIPRSASAKYPGVAFEVDNKKVLVKWDFQIDKVYVVIHDYEYGKIMPIRYETPNKGFEEIYVLKQLEDFEVTPTHIRNDAGINVEVVPIELPNTTTDKPGSRPGLDIKFKQPKTLNNTTWQYEYATTDMDDITAIIELDDIGSDSYFDMNFKLKNDIDNLIYNIDTEAGGANDNVIYLYDPVTYEYTIRLVKDKTPLADPTNFIQWSELEPSSIYDVNVGFQVELGSTNFDEFEFTSYKPVTKFAFTNMAYELKRSNVEEAYLDITPFNAGESEEIEYVILYSKVIKPTLDVSEDLWLKNYHTSDDGNDEIFIPVPFRSTSSQDAYQIVVNFAGQEIYSQVLNYKAIEDLDVPPTTPNIDLIENLFVVPPLVEDAVDPTKVQFDIVWSAPTNKEIKELDTIFEDLNLNPNDDKLYYELSVNDVPTDTAGNPFDVVKVFEVTKVAGEYRIDLYAPLPGQAVPSDVVNFTDGYNETDEQFRMDQIDIYDNDAWANVLTTTIDDDTDTYTVVDSGVEADFEFPGINYVRLKAITIKDGEIATSPLSIPNSLSLSMNVYDVPTVDTLEYKPLYGVEEDRTTGVTLEWHSVDVANYENNMLAPISKTINNLVYSVYIAEEKSDVLPLDEDDSNYNSYAMTNDNLVEIDAATIDLLRSGEVVYFDLHTNKAFNTDYTVDIQGLDVNRDYYIRIVTKVVINDQPDQGNPDETRRSDPSNVLSTTVPKTPDEPGDEEVLPLAPENFVVEFADESFINAGLRWYMPEEMTFTDDLNGFEIIAIEDRSLPADLSSNTTTLTDILNNVDLANDVVEGWRLYVHNGTTYYKKYDPDTGLYVDKNLNLVSIDGNFFYAIDDANAPNKVNYYYVRTVKMSDEEVKSASPWAVGTLTTAPVKGPIDLTVDYESIYTFNPKEELIIRFDAPIPDVNLIGTDYMIEIHVKGEDDVDYSTSKYTSTYLGNSADGPPGYKRLFYEISDLVPGKTYSIKVRIQDRTKPQETLPDGSMEYPKSPFSDRVVTRTEFDQETYDKENKYFEYIDYYMKKAEELKELLYFKVTDTVDETAVKYRENYSEGIIRRNRNGQLELYSDNKAINTYFIPSNSLAAINDQEVMLMIESKEHIVGIRPDTVGVRITDEINEILDNIDQYTSTNEDYYLRIRVYTDAFNGKINGVIPSSDLVEVEFAVVGSKKIEEDMDANMVSTLNSVIQANLSELIVEIELELAKGINDVRLLSIVEELVDEVESEYVGLASIFFKGNIETEVRSVNEINQSLSIGLKSTNVNSTDGVYTKLNGSWRYVNSSYFNQRYYVETSSLEPYITLPGTTGSTDLVDLYGQEAVSVINKYNLTSVFSSYDLSHPTEALDKYQWINALSRLLGANPGEDTVDYLIDRNVYATAFNVYEPIYYDEALMSYIEAYAFKHLIPVSQIYVSNYYIVDDINEATDVYQLTIIKAANLGIIQTDGGNIYPKHRLNIDDAMELLTTLELGLN